MKNIFKKLTGYVLTQYLLFILFPIFSPIQAQTNLSHTSRLNIPITYHTSLVLTKNQELSTKNLIVSDYLSSTKQIIKEDCSIVEQPSYYPYGTFHSYTPGVKEIHTPGVNDNNRYYTGQRKVTNDSPIYNYNARYYNPNLGIFIQPDSVEGPNRYAYVGGNPIMKNDPSGNAKLEQVDSKNDNNNDLSSEVNRWWVWVPPEERGLRQKGPIITDYTRKESIANGTSGWATLPQFGDLWQSYPHGYLDEVKNNIGGTVNADWVTNSCIIRICFSLNSAGYTIPSNYIYESDSNSGKYMSTLMGAGGEYYAFRVSEFTSYMHEVFGPPDLSYFNPEKNLEGFKQIPDAFIGKQVIIVFKFLFQDDQGNIAGTGHFDLWSRNTTTYKNYFFAAKEVHLWLTPDKNLEQTRDQTKTASR